MCAIFAPTSQNLSYVKYCNVLGVFIAYKIFTPIVFNVNKAARALFLWFISMWTYRFEAVRYLFRAITNILCLWMCMPESAYKLSGFAEKWALATLNPFYTNIDSHTHQFEPKLCKIEFNFGIFEIPLTVSTPILLCMSALLMIFVPMSYLCSCVSSHLNTKQRNQCKAISIQHCYIECGGMSMVLEENETRRNVTRQTHSTHFC